MTLTELVLLLGFLLSWYQIIETSRTSREALSMQTFLRALDEFADPKARKDRRYVYRNFPNYTMEDYSVKKWKQGVTEEIETMGVFIFDGDKFTPASKEVKKLDRGSIDNDEYVISGEISVRIDRIGYMFDNIDITDEFKKSYIEWLCVTFCDLWNHLAPHIAQRRGERAQFVPYFEKMAYLSFPLYKRQRKLLGQDAQIIVLNKKLLEDNNRDFRSLWCAPE